MSIKFIPMEEFYACIALTLIKTSYSGWFLYLWHKVSGSLDVIGKSGLRIHNQQEKGYQKDELFFLGFEKVLRMQASVIDSYFTISMLFSDKKSTSVCKGAVNAV